MGIKVVFSMIIHRVLLLVLMEIQRIILVMIVPVTLMEMIGNFVGILRLLIVLKEQIWESRF